jgi:hypothetical protein
MKTRVIERESSCDTVSLTLGDWMDFNTGVPIPDKWKGLQPWDVVAWQTVDHKEEVTFQIIAETPAERFALENSDKLVLEGHEFFLKRVARKIVFGGVDPIEYWEVRAVRFFEPEVDAAP